MLREIGIRDCRDNLFEFTLSLSQHVDFDTFDVLSVTRVEEEPGTEQNPGHTQFFLHPKVPRQYPQGKTQAQIIPLRPRPRRD